MDDALAAACDQAVHVIRADGTVLRAGRAVLFVLENLGWGWAAKLLTLPPFIWIVEGLYAVVAANRAFFARFLFRQE